MKKAFVLAFAVAVSCVAARSEQTAPRYLHAASASVSLTQVPVVPERTVQEVDDGVIVTYKFSGASVWDDSASDATRLGMGGGGPWDTAGEPALFSRTDHFTLPEGFAPIVEVLSADYREIPFNLAAAIPARLYSDTTEAEVAPIAPYAGFKPENAVNALVPGDYRGQKVARIEVSPFQYSQENSTLRVYSTISYKITYSGREKSRKAIDPNGLAGDIVPIDPPVPPTLSVAVPKNESYLIVTVPKYEHALADFIRWKQLLGFNVHVASQPSWTPDEIKAAVRQTYAEDPDLWYLLIVGSHDDVPGEYRPEIIVNGKGHNAHYTDLHYTCLSDDDDIPDLYKGRWSVRSTDDVANIATKSIWYELNPPTSPHFYSNAPHCAYFEHDRKSGNEGARFMETSEDVRNYLTSYHKKNIQRIYWDADDSSIPPKNWNCNDSLLLGSGGLIPDDVIDAINQKSNFKDLINAINNGCHYMLYRGHGYPTQFYSEIIPTAFSIFGRENIHLLYNAEWPTLCFNITCHTGNYAVDFNGNSVICFAEMLHNRLDGGAIGVFAASEVGYMGYDDALTCSMFNAIWPKPGFGLQMGKYFYQSVFDKPEYGLGSILHKSAINVIENYGESHSSKYTQEIFHLFGDPGMLFTTDVPGLFDNVEINRRDRNIQVISYDEEAYISFYDHLTGESTRMYGNVASYNAVNSQNVTVTVSGHNKVPSINSGDEIDNSDTTEHSCYLISCKDNHNGSIRVNYHITPDVKASLVVVRLTAWNTISAEMQLQNEDDYIDFRLSSGIYAVSLMIDNYPVDTKRIIIR